MRILQLVVAVTLSFILTGCYNEIYHEQANRKVGEPINGVWYVNNHGGCYESSGIIKFKGNKGWFYTYESVGKVYDIKDLSWELNTLHFEGIEYLPHNQNIKTNVYFIIRDAGGHLFFEKLRKNGGKLKKFSKERILVRCGRYSFSEWFMTSLGIEKLWRGFTEKNPTWRQPTPKEIEEAKRR